MSFSSELALMEVSKLERILKKGLETNNKSIIQFLRREVYPTYLENIQETNGAYEEDEDIKNGYD